VIPHGSTEPGRGPSHGITGALQRCADDDLVATMDADNTHDPALLPLMARSSSGPRRRGDRLPLLPGGEEVGLTALRKVLSRGASFLLSMVARVPGARDYTCGYRLYRSRCCAALQAWGDRLIERRFVCMAELLVKLGRGGARSRRRPGAPLRSQGGREQMKVMQTISRYFVMARRVRSNPIPRVSGREYGLPHSAAGSAPGSGRAAIRRCASGPPRASPRDPAQRRLVFSMFTTRRRMVRRRAGRCARVRPGRRSGDQDRGQSLTRVSTGADVEHLADRALRRRGENGGLDGIVDDVKSRL